MRAEVGDRLVVHGRRVDDGVREGVVVEVPHPDGSPPYLVRWLDDDHVGVVFPGPDTTIRPGGPGSAGTEEAGAP
jgi:hypothetical protein